MLSWEFPARLHDYDDRLASRKFSHPSAGFSQVVQRKFNPGNPVFEGKIRESDSIECFFNA